MALTGARGHGKDPGITAPEKHRGRLPARPTPPAPPPAPRGPALPPRRPAPPRAPRASGTKTKGGGGEPRERGEATPARRSVGARAAPVPARPPAGRPDSVRARTTPTGGSLSGLLRETRLSASDPCKENAWPRRGLFQKLLTRGFLGTGRARPALSSPPAREGGLGAGHADVFSETCSPRAMKLSNAGDVYGKTRLATL